MEAGSLNGLFDNTVTRHLRVMRPNLFELILCILFPLIRPVFVCARGVLSPRNLLAKLREQPLQFNAKIKGFHRRNRNRIVNAPAHVLSDTRNLWPQTFRDVQRFDFL